MLLLAFATRCLDMFILLLSQSVSKPRNLNLKRCLEITSKLNDVNYNETVGDGVAWQRLQIPDTAPVCFHTFIHLVLKGKAKFSPSFYFVHLTTQKFIAKKENSKWLWFH